MNKFIEYIRLFRTLIDLLNTVKDFTRQEHILVTNFGMRKLKKQNLGHVYWINTAYNVEAHQLGQSGITIL